MGKFLGLVYGLTMVGKFYMFYYYLYTGRVTHPYPVHVVAPSTLAQQQSTMG